MDFQSTPTHAEKPHWRHSGFTIVELLVVIALMVGLMSLALPAISSITEANNLASGAQILNDQLVLSRQTAMSRNRPVHVRIFAPPDPAAAQAQWALQTWLEGETTPHSRVVYLPEGIAVVDGIADASPLYSSIMDTGTLPAGGVMGGRTYHELTIHPNGTVTPEPATAAEKRDYFITIASKKRLQGGSLPPNFITIQINPDTGRSAVHQP